MIDRVGTLATSLAFATFLHEPSFLYSKGVKRNHA